MTIRFKTTQLETWFEGNYSGKQPFSEVVLKAYRKAIGKLQAAPSTVQLRQNKSLDFHPLKHELTGKFAVRVTMQYRIVFAINQETDELEVIEVEQLTDYH
jgi:plasmid maintenance system killer protein